MITFYIDDSGSKEVNDSAQPIFLFSGVAITNEKFLETNEFISNEIKRVSKIIMDKLVGSRVKGVKPSEVKTLLKTYLFREFELHATDLIHGKKEYICLSKNEKADLLKNIFEYIKKNEIKVIIIKCEKDKIINNDEIPKKENQKYLNNLMIDKLGEVYEEYLEKNDEQGILVFDQGNDLIDKEFVKFIRDRENKRISPYVAQAKSCDTTLIQLADFTAYIANIYFNKSDKYYDDLKKYYDIIKDNIILYEIN